MLSTGTGDLHSPNSLHDIQRMIQRLLYGWLSLSFPAELGPAAILILVDCTDKHPTATSNWQAANQHTLDALQQAVQAAAPSVPVLVEMVLPDSAFGCHVVQFAWGSQLEKSTFSTNEAAVESTQHTCVYGSGNDVEAFKNNLPFLWGIARAAQCGFTFAAHVDSDIELRAPKADWVQTGWIVSSVQVLQASGVLIYGLWRFQTAMTMSVIRHYWTQLTQTTAPMSNHIREGLREVYDRLSYHSVRESKARSIVEVQPGVPLVKIPFSNGIISHISASSFSRN